MGKRRGMVRQAWGQLPPGPPFSIAALFVGTLDCVPGYGMGAAFFLILLERAVEGFLVDILRVWNPGQGFADAFRQVFAILVGH